MRPALLLPGLWSLPALAHDAAPAAFRWADWEPWITGPLLLAMLLYGRGLARLWRRRREAGVRSWRAACFWLGAGVLLANFLSPLHALAARWFAAHMGEHELLMAVAAPLFALSRPLPVMLWGLPAPLRRAVAACGRGLGPVWRGLTRPAVATAVHALAIWVWHAPVLFDAALAHPALHALQHLSFLGSALLFWSALLNDRLYARYGAALMYLFVTSAHTMLLGAILVFARQPWYAPAPGAGALTALEDQQLAGLLMWMPGGLVYAIAALFLCYLWVAGVRPQDRSDHAAA